MMKLLASGQVTTATDGQLGLLVVCVAILCVAAGFAFVPIRMVRVKGHRWGGLIIAGTVLWALAAAGSVIATTLAENQYSQEYALRIGTGYFDPRDTSDAPVWPWGLWAGLAAGYGGLVAAAWKTK